MTTTVLIGLCILLRVYQSIRVKQAENLQGKCSQLHDITMDVAAVNPQDRSLK
jgi:hypothetical protein